MKKRIWMCAMAVMMLLTCMPAALAQEDPMIQPYEDAEPYAYTETFASFTGEVTVHEPLSNGTGYLMFLENEEGEEVSFLLLNKSTYSFRGGLGPSLGEKVTAYYRVPEINILIYPPRYTALAIAPADEMTYVGRFDENFVSTDNVLKLLGMETIPIIRQDGSAFEGNFQGVIAAVSYKVSTRSIPAQTTPDLVVVLDKAHIPVFAPVIVAGQTLADAPSAMKTGDDKLLVPLRAIAEALGYEVGWEHASRSVTLDGSAALSIGADDYSFGEQASVALGAAPRLIDGHTYVPLNFFTKILGLNNAYFFENEIVVNNGEKME